VVDIQVVIEKIVQAPMARDWIGVSIEEIFAAKAMIGDLTDNLTAKFSICQTIHCSF